MYTYLGDPLVVGTSPSQVLLHLELTLTVLIQVGYVLSLQK